ncbi:MAG TPA: cysteine synthase A [Polyangiaceae bacterium]|nr:cysteine synthase A [Polyangiaceae bacterium]
MALFQSISDLIGETPLLRLRRLSEQCGLEILAKLEGGNPAGSVKDRIARSMVDDAERSGRLKPGATLIEPTSGNTGISLAMIAAARGYHLVLTMPEAMSRERVALLKAYGAEVILTPGTLMREAVAKAEQLGRETRGAVLLHQFDNPANPAVHAATTGPEIWRDTEGKLDLFVAGIGTGGTITGVCQALKPRSPSLFSVGVEPAGAAVLSGAAAGQHHIQGIGAGFVPKVLDRSLVDRVLPISEEAAISAARNLARAEGVLAGVSSGAALAAVLQLASEPRWKGKRCVVMFPDAGERYVSTTLFRAMSG